MAKTPVMNSFKRQFVAILQGDDAGALSEKAWRGAESSLKVHIAASEGDSIKLEDDVRSAQEELNAARVNHGKIITSREAYIENLIRAKNDLNAATKALKNHEDTLKFLMDEYAALRE